ncbi:uncharacterized protein TNCV_4709751 [Trichonephila clavipes]|nr:uncharacterized protein TNCV_4709751 [Trichonephila clavipes]
MDFDIKCEYVPKNCQRKTAGSGLHEARKSAPKTITDEFQGRYNAPCHRAEVVQKWLKDHTVNRMNWPGQSPEFNLIENLWFKIGYEISKKKPSNKRELIEALIFSFNHIVPKDLLLKLVHSMPKRCRDIIKELWFQQDGATCHTARATIDLLKDTFDRLISRFGPVNWQRSYDLTPLDYFLWGYVKSLVYADKPQTLDHLEDNIRRVIADIRPQMLEKVIENWTSRLDYIPDSRGSSMPEIIFKNNATRLSFEKKFMSIE